MLVAGLILTAAAVLYLILSFARAPKSVPYPAQGLAGLAVIAVAELLLYLQVPFVTIYFTPIVWTGYILAVDAAVFSIRGRSLVRSEPQAFLWMAVLSIFLWLGFELYNLRLRNWTYVGLPLNDFLRYMGYGWAFATIWPSILETAELLSATQFRHHRRPSVLGASSADESILHLDAPAAAAPPTKRVTGWVVLGLVMVTAPVLVPIDWGQYLFGFVWLGFIFLIDPLNQRAGRASIWGDCAQGYRGRLWALLLAGGICGVLWEFWNYWAAAKWFYIFPIFEQWRVFEMPLPGYLGFPPFAVEVFALYVFVANLLKLPYYEPA